MQTATAGRQIVRQNRSPQNIPKPTTEGRMVSPLFDGAFQALDSNGNPISGAKLNTYETDLSTPKQTFTTAALSVANANPVVADSAGRFPPIYLSTGAYGMIMTDASDNTIETIPSVSQPVDTDDLQDSDGYYRKLWDTTSKPFFQIGNMRVWYDATNDRVRYKVGSDPTSETDGTAIGAAFDDAFNETGLLELGAFKIFVQALGQVRMKNGTPSSASDGTLISNLFSGDFGDGDTDLIRYDRSGTVYRQWLDADGTPRLLSGSAPSNDDDGYPIGGPRTGASGTLTSGTTEDITNFGVTTPRKIEIWVGNLASSGTDNLTVTIGDSGGLETSSYAAASSIGTSTANSAATFIIRNSGLATHGKIELVHLGSNLWACSSALGGTSGGTNGGIIGGGAKTLSAALTQIQLGWSGSDTFSAGTYLVLGYPE